MQIGNRETVIPYYVITVLWLVCGLLLPFYKVSYYVLLIFISVVVFFVVKFICTNAEAIGHVAHQNAVGKEKEVKHTTGNAELDKVINNGTAALAEMRRLDDNIADPNISANIVRLEQVSQKIFEEVRRDPKKLPKICRFMDYYLPTTLKLLNSYDRMSATGVSGENINTTLLKVEEMMKTIVSAFEKQLDSLYGADALDISSDITVLETMMAREGLTGQGFKTTPSNDTDIRLEL